MAQEIADSKLLDTWSSSGTKIEPDITKIIEGWQLGEQPPHEYMNWLQNTFGSKLNHILKNGIAEWNNETEYLAGSSVQHSGNVWICETTNTNSEPTDLNANWEKVAINKDLTVTVDTLADLKNISYPANTVWASGYHTKNDGAFGSNFFRLKGTKTTETDNGGTVIIATINAVDYVYELQYDGAVNVKWFGANELSNNNSPFIQAAIDTASLYTGMDTANVDSVGINIYIPKGVFKIQDTIEIIQRYNVNITGDGKYVSILEDNSTSGNLLMISVNQAGDTFKTSQLRLESFGLYSDRKTKPNSAGIFINASADVHLINLNINGFTHVDATDSRLSDGFFDPDDITFKNYGILFNFVVSQVVQNCTISWCGAGVAYRGYSNSASTIGKILNSYINYSGYGIYTYNNYAPGLSLIGTTIEANYSPGYGVYNNENSVNLYGCWLELNTTHLWISRNAKINANGTKFLVPRPSQPLFVFDNPVTTYSNQHTFDNCTISVFDTSNNTTIVNANLISNDIKGTGVLTYTRCNVLNQGVDSSYINDKNGLKLGNYIQINSETGTPFVATWGATSSGSKFATFKNSANANSVASGNTLIKAEATNTQGDGLRALSCVQNGIETAFIGVAGGAYFGITRPMADNTFSLGTSIARWSVVYAGTGTINTSDDREKTYIDITNIEKQVAIELKANMRKFKFNDAIIEKGEDKARIHFGASAQTVKSIFEKHGLNAFDYAILCYDEWKDEYENVILEDAILDDEANIIKEAITEKKLVIKAGNRYGLRYDELLCFIMSAL